jgi:hypothetical protein
MVDGATNETEGVDCVGVDASGTETGAVVSASGAVTEREVPSVCADTTSTGARTAPEDCPPEKILHPGVST